MSQSKDYNFISNYYKSFSGADTLVFILMPGSNPVILGSITTVSYSVYRTKQPVINLGRTNINGITRGARIFAGTMVFTLINQHWVNDLKESESLEWLNAYEDLKTDELPLFDLMIVSANEYGSYISMFIYGVDVTDEGQVISVEDLFTENTLSFVARDITSFKAGDSINPEKTIYKTSNISQVMVNNFYITESTANNEQNMKDYMDSLVNEQINRLKENAQIKEYKDSLSGFTRELQYAPFNLMVGDDVSRIQTKLREYGYLDTVTNMYDSKTQEAVQKFQSASVLDITGVVDSKTYIAILSQSNNNSNSITGIVINQSGTRVYSYPNINSDIIDTIPYNQIVTIYDKIDEKTLTDHTTNDTIGTSGHVFYQIEEGYVSVNDIYSYEYSNKDFAFPTINKYESGPYVTILQELLVKLYGTYDYTSGVYDDNTIAKVIKLQTENNITCVLGIVNEETWRVLYALTGNEITNITNSNITVTAGNPQGKYSVNSLDIETQLLNGLDVTISSLKNTSVKCCGIAYYKNGNQKTLTKSYDITANSPITIPFEAFQNLFTYSIADGYPVKIEYIVFPYNSESYKWIIDYRGE